MRRTLFFLMTMLLGATPALAQQSTCGEDVTVTYGDTLYLIAERCNTSLDAVIAANPQLENPNVIEVGQTIQMPGADRAERGREPAPREGDGAPASGDPASGDTDTYVVRPGDTLAEIADQFGLTIDALVRANGQIQNPAVIEV
ncbi:MAG: LysM peptidoglycan-binding domain-containing protein, partial [Xanthomonadales bacterium]|nr:LysM peptidoglycan-binding domain-containing protein [Xanthomonadales bacterium]